MSAIVNVIVSYLSRPVRREGRTATYGVSHQSDAQGTTRIVNDADRLAAVLRRAGESPQVVLEATYGWYWAADVIAAEGAHTHLAHPLG
jgi:hypothetical protein